MEVVNIDDIYSNLLLVCNLLVIYGYKGIVVRRDRDGESVLFMLVKMF